MTIACALSNRSSDPARARPASLAAGARRASPDSSRPSRERRAAARKPLRSSAVRRRSRRRCRSAVRQRASNRLRPQNQRIVPADLRRSRLPCGRAAAVSDRARYKSRCCSGRDRRASRRRSHRRSRPTSCAAACRSARPRTAGSRPRTACSWSACDRRSHGRDLKRYVFEVSAPDRTELGNVAGKVVPVRSPVAVAMMSRAPRSFTTSWRSPAMMSSKRTQRWQTMQRSSSSTIVGPRSTRFRLARASGRRRRRCRGA